MQQNFLLHRRFINIKWPAFPLRLKLLPVSSGQEEVHPPSSCFADFEPHLLQPYSSSSAETDAQSCRLVVEGRSHVGSLDFLGNANVLLVLLVLWRLSGLILIRSLGSAESRPTNQYMLLEAGRPQMMFIRKFCCCFYHVWIVHPLDLVPPTCVDTLSFGLPQVLLHFLQSFVCSFVFL